MRYLESNSFLCGLFFAAVKRQSFKDEARQLRDPALNIYRYTQCVSRIDGKPSECTSHKILPGNELEDHDQTVLLDHFQDFIISRLGALC